HGLDAGQESLNVTINAIAAPAGVEITVENDGASVGLESPRPGGHGVGLAATRARLMTVHGDRASLTLEPRNGGGAIVRVVMPRRTAARSKTHEPVALQEA